ncbi:hypothetical protein [Undibacterium sp.]|jgi:hypothetical protein|uniref:hypothetical protein n=1 Tax=Undibacterium sp. TaxID=1914977 RepID=UPI002B8894C8|nr:hypothetical protein [Undibacterium sp.]HTD06199.1 hypothetical protein [Undibacterium sp.]
MKLPAWSRVGAEALDNLPPQQALQDCACRIFITTGRIRWTVMRVMLVVRVMRVVRVTRLRTKSGLQKEAADISPIRLPAGCGV